MPKIQPITASPNIGSRIEHSQATASMFGGAEGRALEGFGRNVTEMGMAFQRRKEQDEVGEAQKRVAEEQSKLAVEWNETLKTADPADNTLAERFNDQAKERLEALGDGLETGAAQSHLKASIARTRSHFYESTLQGQSTLRGLKAREDAEKTLSAQSMTAFNDPHTFSMTLDQTDEYIGGMVEAKKLSPIDAEKLRNDARTKLAQSTIRGWANVDPSIAAEKLNSGEFDSFMSGDLKKQMLGEVERSQNARELDVRKREADQEKHLKRSQEATQQALLVDMVNGRLTAEKVMASNLDAIGGGSKEHFLKMLSDDVKTGTVKKSDMNTYSMLMAMASTPELKDQFLETDIVKEYGGKLSHAHQIAFLKEQAEIRKSGRSSRMDGFLSDKQIATSLAQSAGIKKKEELNLFTLELDAEVGRFTQMNKRRPTNDEVRGMGDGLLKEIVTKERSFWFDEKKRAFEIPNNERQALIVPKKDAVTFDDIPKDKLEKYKAYFSARKKPFSRDAIIELYMADTARAQKGAR